jgi:hypothetical protein
VALATGSQVVRNPWFVVGWIGAITKTVDRQTPAEIIPQWIMADEEPQKPPPPSADANWEEFTQGLPGFVDAINDGMDCIIQQAHEMNTGSGSDIQGNFPDDKQTAETALLFLQLIMRKLRKMPKPGRAGVVVPNGTLFGDNVCARIKEELLKEFNLHTIVRLPNSVFAPYTGIQTNLLFFDRSGPTTEIWYYEQPLPEARKNYTKSQPMQYEEFADCIEWWNGRNENDRAWKVPAEQVLKYGDDGRLVSVNLDIKNPNGKADFEHLPPERLIENIIAKERMILDILEQIKVSVGIGVRARLDGLCRHSVRCSKNVKTGSEQSTLTNFHYWESATRKDCAAPRCLGLST